MTTTDREGRKWILWFGGDCPVTGPVHVITQRGVEHKVDHAKFLHWPRYRVSEFNIVAYRVPSTANAAEGQCIRERQFDDD